MADSAYSLDRFKEEYEENERKRSEFKERVNIPFLGHRDRYESHSAKCQEHLEQIIAARQRGDDLKERDYTEQYVHLRRQQDQSIATFKIYQRLALQLDDLFNILEISLVIKGFAELGDEVLGKAAEANTGSAPIAWDMKKREEDVKTQLSTIMKKLAEDTDDFFSGLVKDEPDKPDGPDRRGGFKQEIDDAFDNANEGESLPPGEPYSLPPGEPEEMDR